jgi:membrane-associated protein
MITRLLDPVLNLHGWQAYALVGFLVFAEVAILIGIVFPGETAVIVGGVVASRGHANIVVLIIVVVACAIAGNTVGYAVGAKWGSRILDLKYVASRRHTLDRTLERINRRGAIVVFVARFGAFLRAVVPGLAGIAGMPYRKFQAANVAGALVWGTAFCLLGYAVGNAYKKVEHASSLASDVLLGVIVVVVIGLVIRHRRRERATQD